MQLLHEGNYFDTEVFTAELMDSISAASRMLRIFFMVCFSLSVINKRHNSTVSYSDIVHLFPVFVKVFAVFYIGVSHIETISVP